MNIGAVPTCSSLRPADAAFSSSFNADATGSSAGNPAGVRSSLPPIPAASVQQPLSTDAATQQQPLAIFEGREDPQQLTKNMGLGFRTKYPSVKLRDHVTQTIFASSPSLPAPVADHSSGTSYPFTHYIHCDNFSINYRKFIAAIVSNNDPKSFKKAMKYDGWRQSMKEEIRVLKNNVT